ncbi:MAG TPA: tRNA pseudouridine(55) synthase TruB [Parachlamydiaceae bacterium]|nr:tRNA pseudouridine(55) synthase TruB [Parachlamydiaceae bacterium]
MDQIATNEKITAGILLVNKPAGKTSFQLVAALRKILEVKKIGHAGTLDPFATGVMVMLIGREYTKLSDSLLTANKEYLATVRLGASTDTYDLDGKITEESSLVPSLAEIEAAISCFQGELEQIPPMYSAKKIQGQKLCDLARKGKTVERKPCKVHLETAILEYNYPNLSLKVKCSKGTYIRSIAYDLGNKLGCFGHLSALERIGSGQFPLNECMDGAILFNTEDKESLKAKVQQNLRIK